MNFIYTDVFRYTYAKKWQSNITLTQCFVFVSLTFVADPLEVLDDFKDSDTSTRNFVIFFGSALISYGVAMEVFNVASVIATLGENVSTS